MWIEKHVEHRGFKAVVYELGKDNSLPDIDQAKLVGPLSPPYFDGSPVWLLESRPVSLSTRISNDSVNYNVSVRFYDKKAVMEKVFGHIEELEKRGDQFRIESTHKFLETLESNDYVGFRSCQRGYSGPKVKDPNSPITIGELRKLLPGIESIFESLCDTKLKDPFRELQYYLDLIELLKIDVME